MPKGGSCFIGEDALRLMKARHGVLYRMAEASVPKIEGVVGDEGFIAGSLAHRVEGTGAIAAKNHDPAG